MRGIRFNIPNLYDSFINNILSGICVEQYIWKIGEAEVYLNMQKSLFLEEILTGLDFKKTISHPSYYIVFANLRAYPTGSEINEINGYDDFLKSSCEINILISDSVFVEVYAKDEKIINEIKHNAVLWHYKEIEYITDGNDYNAEFCAK